MILPRKLGGAVEMLVQLEATPTTPPKPDKALIVGSDWPPREPIVPWPDWGNEHHLGIGLSLVAVHSVGPCFGGVRMAVAMASALR